MPPFGPISRYNLIRALRKAGFSGPYTGKRHEFMQKETLRVRIPNPHSSDIGKPLLAEILRQAGIDRATWEAL